MLKIEHLTKIFGKGTINEMTVFSQFLQQICGTEPTKEDEILFQKLFTELKEEQTNS